MTYCDIDECPSGDRSAIRNAAGKPLDRFSRCQDENPSKKVEKQDILCQNDVVTFDIPRRPSAIEQKHKDNQHKHKYPKSSKTEVLTAGLERPGR